jgi:hypothetical protein
MVTTKYITTFTFASHCRNLRFEGRAAYQSVWWDPHLRFPPRLDYFQRLSQLCFIKGARKQKTARTAAVVGRFDHYPLVLRLASAMAISPEITHKMTGED